MSTPSEKSIATVLSEREPAAVWTHFATLCHLPRQPKAAGALREHMRQWALGQGLAASVDGLGKLMLRKAASHDSERARGLVLQAHLDMVSVGPTTCGAHAPGERVEIASVAKAWQRLKAMLASAAGEE